jgi:cytochrome c-type biogenesis protein CcmH
MRALRALLFAIACLAAAPVFAVQPDEMLADPALEARARALSQELRCMVCQNQSIDDSAAPLARDLRLLVRERLQAGDTDRQVLDFLVRRYGDFVLLKPPLNWDTALLWFIGPFVLLIAGLSLWPMIRRARRGPTGGLEVATVPLSLIEERRLQQLLDDGEAHPPTGAGVSNH